MNLTEDTLVFAFINLELARSISPRILAIDQAIKQLHIIMVVEPFSLDADDTNTSVCDLLMTLAVLDRKNTVHGFREASIVA